jgi:hypothetical protein
MVKITFQSVAGQKGEKDNDGDKTEILIPHPMVSTLLMMRLGSIVYFDCYILMSPVTIFIRVNKGMKPDGLW